MRQSAARIARIARKNALISCPLSFAAAWGLSYLAVVATVWFFYKSGYCDVVTQTFRRFSSFSTTMNLCSALIAPVFEWMATIIMGIVIGRFVLRFFWLNVFAAWFGGFIFPWIIWSSDALKPENLLIWSAYCVWYIPAVIGALVLVLTARLSCRFRSATLVRGFPLTTED